MKSGGGNRKGGAFERQICKDLSIWWSNGSRDDIFRRSATSGGRATIRSKKGKDTFGQYGDIAIADPIGQPLISLCTIELKTGYFTQSPFDLVDSPSRQNPHYKKFFEQCLREKKEAKTPHWLLIAKRKHKEIMVYMPHSFYRLCRMYLDEAFPSIRLSVPVGKTEQKIFGCPLVQFFRLLRPSHIVKILNTYKDKENADPK